MDLPVGGVSIEHAEQFHQLRPVRLGQGDQHGFGTYAVLGRLVGAQDNGVPFYVALPHSTIDWCLSDGIAEIPIEERDQREVTHISGLGEDGSVIEVQVTPQGSPAANVAFDVTPARLVTGLITERGVADASAEGLVALYPERAG